MRQQPDKFFRDKLNDFSQTPPDQVWDRISNGMNQRTSAKRLYLRIAASFLLLIMAGYGATQLLKEETASSITSNDSQKHENLAHSQPITKDVSKEDSSAVETILPKKIEQPFKPKTSDKNPIRKPSVQKEVVEPVEPQQFVAEANTSSKDTTVIEDNFEHRTQLAYKAPAQKSTTIIFTAEQTSEYLIAKNETTEATSDDKPTSTLKKLLKKAAELSTNQDPLGELRQKKNEILALNFKSDKQRGQKK